MKDILKAIGVVICFIVFVFVVSIGAVLNIIKIILLGKDDNDYFNDLNMLSDNIKTDNVTGTNAKQIKTLRVKLDYVLVLLAIKYIES